MRTYQITGAPAKGQETPWILQQLSQISRCSQIDATQVAMTYKITNPPAVPVRTLDPTTATVQDVANLIATFLRDLQLGGTNLAAP
jgi:hypothetical protein